MNEEKELAEALEWFDKKGWESFGKSEDWIYGLIIFKNYRAEKAMADDLQDAISPGNWCQKHSKFHPLGPVGLLECQNSVDWQVKAEKAEQALEAAKAKIEEYESNYICAMHNRFICSKCVDDLRKTEQSLREALAWGDRLREALVDTRKIVELVYGGPIPYHDVVWDRGEKVLDFPRPGGPGVK